MRETPCWWIANDKVCPDGDRCNFRHVAEEKEQTVSGTSASWSGPATEQNDSGTGVLSPGPSLRRKHPKGSTCDRWNNSWDRYDYRDKWTDVWKSDHDGNRWIRGWNEHHHDDNWTDAWKNVTLVTSGVRATGKLTAGVNKCAVVESFFLRDNECGAS